MKLRVFYVVHERKKGGIDYKKEKSFTDFDHDDIYTRYGRFYMDERTNRAPDKWVEINSHTFIDPDREVVRLPEERVYEAPLFPAEFYKETLSRKPE